MWRSYYTTNPSDVFVYVDSNLGGTIQAPRLREWLFNKTTLQWVYAGASTPLGADWAPTRSKSRGSKCLPRTPIPYNI